MTEHEHHDHTQGEYVGERDVETAGDYVGERPVTPKGSYVEAENPTNSDEAGEYTDSELPESASTSE